MLSTTRAAASRRLVRGWAAPAAPGDRPPPGDPQASDPVTDPAVRSEGGPQNEKNQTPARYAASKLAANTAFFAKGARLVVKSVADRVSGNAHPRPQTTSEPAGGMEGTNDTAEVKFETMMQSEEAARKATGHKEPLTAAYPAAAEAARATAGVDEKGGKEDK